MARFKRQGLPQFIWVKKEKDGDSTYLIANKEPIDLCEKGEMVVTGLYEFKEVQKLGLRIFSSH